MKNWRRKTCHGKKTQSLPYILNYWTTTSYYSSFDHLGMNRHKNNFLSSLRKIFHELCCNEIDRLRAAYLMSLKLTTIQRKMMLLKKRLERCSSYLIKILHTIHITPTLVYKVTTDIPRLLFLLHNYVLTPILRIINSLKEIDKGRFSETKNMYQLHLFNGCTVLCFGIHLWTKRIQ